MFAKDFAFVYYTKSRKVLKVHLRVSWSGSTESGGYKFFCGSIS